MNLLKKILKTLFRLEKHVAISNHPSAAALYCECGGIIAADCENMFCTECGRIVE